MMLTMMMSQQPDEESCCAIVFWETSTAMYIYIHCYAESPHKKKKTVAGGTMVTPQPALLHLTPPVCDPVPATSTEAATIATVTFCIATSLLSSYSYRYMLPSFFLCT